MSKDKLNNLLSIEDYSDKKFLKGAKPTKRTEVAKDIFEGADVTGKIASEKPKSTEDVVFKKLHNICSIDEFTEKEVLKDNKPTKRTEVAKDVLQEKKKDKECGCKKDEEEDDEEDKKPKKGLTKAQKRLPEALQKAILKKQGK